MSPNFIETKIRHMLLPVSKLINHMKRISDSPTFNYNIDSKRTKLDNFFWVCKGCE